MEEFTKILNYPIMKKLFINLISIYQNVIRVKVESHGGNQEDLTRDSGVDYASFFFGTNPRVTLANSNGDGAEISGFNKNEDYIVELTLEY